MAANNPNNTRRKNWFAFLVVISLFIILESMYVSSVAFTSVGTYNLTVRSNTPKPTNFTIFFNATLVNSSTGAAIPGASCQLNTTANKTVNVVMGNLTNTFFRANATFADVYNTSFNVSCLIGGEIQLNASDNFTVAGRDTANPAVNTIHPNGTNLTFFGFIGIFVNATDNFEIDGVQVNITFPNGSVRLINAFRGGFGPHAGDEWLAFYDGSPNGTYTISVIANDTSGNINATQRASFNNVFANLRCSFQGMSMNNTQCFDSNFTLSNITGSTFNGSTLYNTSIFNSSFNNGNLNSSFFINGTGINSSMFSCYMNNSNFFGTNATNSTVFGGTYNFTFMFHMEAFNSTMLSSIMNRSYSFGSNITGSSAFFSRMNFSRMINSTMYNTTVIGSIINGSVTTGANMTNSSVSFSTINDSSVITSNISNVTAQGTYMNGSSMTIGNSTNATIYYSTINGSSLYTSNSTNSTIVGEYINGSSVINSNLTNGSVIQSYMNSTSAHNSSISFSTINNSYISNYTIDNSTIHTTTIVDSNTSNSSVAIDNSTLQNSSVTDGYINQSATQDTVVTTSNITDGSVLNHSRVANSSVSDSNISDQSTVMNTTVDGGTVSNSTIINANINSTHLDNSTVENANVTDSSRVNNSVIENSTITSSNVTGVTVGSCALDDAYIYAPNMSADESQGTTTYNLTFRNCYVNSSLVDNMSVINSNVSGGSIMNTTTVGNSSVDGSNVSYSTTLNSSVDGSSVMNSTVTNGLINNTVMQNTTVQNGDITNSYSNNSVVANSSVDNSSVIGSLVIDSNTTSNTTAVGVDNSSLTNSTVMDGYINSSITQNSTVWTSNVTGGSIANHSFIGNSTVDDSNVTDSSNVRNTSIDGANVANSTVSNSYVNFTSMDNAVSNDSDVTNSQVNGSSMTQSTVENSTVTGGSSLYSSSTDNSTIIASTMLNSHSNSSFIDPSTLINSSTTGSNISDSTLDNTTTFNTTVINSIINSSKLNNSVVSLSNLSGMDVINVSIHNSTRVENLTLRNIALINDEPNRPRVLNGSAPDPVKTQGNAVRINVTVIDNSTIGVVLVNVTKPDGTVHSVTMTATATTNVFTALFGNASLAGTYNLTFDVNDSVNLRNATTLNNFTVSAANFTFSLIVINTTIEPEVNVSRNVTYQINITNLGQTNLTNVTVTVNFNTKHINYSISSPGSQANGTGVVALGDAVRGNGLPANSTILINLTFVALANHSNLTTTINVTTLTAIGNVSQQNTTINITIQLVIPTVAQLRGFAAVLADNFTNLTTNFSLVPDLSNVSGLQVANRNGTINWSFSNVNAQANIAPIGDQIRIGKGTLAYPSASYLVLNTTAFHPSFNVSSRITFNNVSCAAGLPPPIVNFNDSIAQSATDVASTGRDCISAGVCANITCVSGSDGRGNLTFTALHFTSFSSSANSNLTITHGPRTVGALTTFNATYINASNGDLINGSTCNISITDEPAVVTNMTIDPANSRFFFQKTPSTAGNFVINVTCTGAGYTTLNSLDNFTLAPVAGSGGVGGGGGGGGGGYRRVNTGSPASPTATATVPATAPTTVTAAVSKTAFAIIDVIKKFYAGDSKLTAFEILDTIKDYYKGP